MEPHGKEDKDGLGGRLKSARVSAGHTQDSAAAALGLKKATFSSWETGRNIPDSIMLGRLAKLYNVTADALIWDEAVSMEAIRFAVQFDNLNDRQQRAFRAMWMAYFEQAISDEEMDGHIKEKVPRGKVIDDAAEAPRPPAKKVSR
jgi:transcriptional regulator with XRE-family HTH domain